MMREEKSVGYGTNPFGAPQQPSGQTQQETHAFAPNYNNAEQPLVNDNIAMGERPPNFPPCKPLFHHNIATDIPYDKRNLVKKAYLGWYIHAVCCLYNMVAVIAGLVKSQGSIADFFYGLLIGILGPPVSFVVYWFFYSSIRKFSAAYFCLWTVAFVLQIALEIFFAVGIPGTGGIGFLSMVGAISDNAVIGVMFAVAFALWAAAALYNSFFFVHARREYNEMGGNKAATREFGKQGVKLAYDNRETIKQVAVDNKDTIKQIAVENKDTIITFAKEHKEEIGRAAYENRDTIWENRDIVASVFDGNNSKPSSDNPFA